MIEEKRIRIMKEIDGVPEEVLDNILALVEESKKTSKEDNESTIDILVKSGVLISLVNPKKPRPEYVPIKVKGKPMSEMVIEDRR